MIVRQIKEHGDNFSYVLFDEVSKEGAVIDPSYNAQPIIDLVRHEGINVKYIIATHSHNDHVAGVSELKGQLNARVAAFRDSPIEKEVELTHGSVLRIGKESLKVIYTPGHSKDSISILARGAIFTGDTLFVGECGRTDLYDGDPKQMYSSLFFELMSLDDDILVYPGHDYGKKPFSTIGEERKSNYTLRRRSLDEFIRFMNEP
uniref:MBL fold metallo-hydrolase n=1 Tax=Candidatus Methanomethylicus mesodigestus TaxID=1867258 RepID=A0A7C3J492_9CREN